jgi:hypothetical protein
MKPLPNLKKRKKELEFSVPPRLVSGVISAYEAYSAHALCDLFHHDREWARDHLIRPINRATKKRLIDQNTGLPIPGVKHFRAGTVTIIRGEALLDWIKEHETQIMD